MIKKLLFGLFMVLLTTFLVENVEAVRSAEEVYDLVCEDYKNIMNLSREEFESMDSNVLSLILNLSNNLLSSNMSDIEDVGCDDSLHIEPYFSLNPDRDWNADDRYEMHKNLFFNYFNRNKPDVLKIYEEADQFITENPDLTINELQLYTKFIEVMEYLFSVSFSDFINMDRKTFSLFMASYSRLDSYLNLNEYDKGSLIFKDFLDKDCMRNIEKHSYMGPVFQVYIKPNAKNFCKSILFNYYFRENILETEGGFLGFSILCDYGPDKCVTAYETMLMPEHLKSFYSVPSPDGEPHFLLLTPYPTSFANYYPDLFYFESENKLKELFSGNMNLSSLIKTSPPVYSLEGSIALSKDAVFGFGRKKDHWGSPIFDLNVLTIKDPVFLENGLTIDFNSVAYENKYPLNLDTMFGGDKKTDWQLLIERLSQSELAIFLGICSDLDCPDPYDENYEELPWVDPVKLILNNVTIMFKDKVGITDSEINNRLAITYAKYKSFNTLLNEQIGSLSESVDDSTPPSEMINSQDEIVNSTMSDSGIIMSVNSDTKKFETIVATGDTSATIILPNNSTIEMETTIPDTPNKVEPSLIIVQLDQEENIDNVTVIGNSSVKAIITNVNNIEVDTAQSDNANVEVSQIETLPIPEMNYDLFASRSDNVKEETLRTVYGETGTEANVGFKGVIIRTVVSSGWYTGNGDLVFTDVEDNKHKLVWTDNMGVVHEWIYDDNGLPEVNTFPEDLADPVDLKIRMVDSLELPPLVEVKANKINVNKLDKWVSDTNLTVKTNKETLEVSPDGVKTSPKDEQKLKIAEIKEIQANITKNCKTEWKSVCNNLVKQRDDAKIELAFSQGLINESQKNTLMNPKSADEKQWRTEFGRKKVFEGGEIKKIKFQPVTLNDDAKHLYWALSVMQGKLNEKGRDFESNESVKLIFARQELIKNMQDAGVGQHIYSKPSGVSYEEYWDSLGEEKVDEKSLAEKENVSEEKNDTNTVKLAITNTEGTVVVNFNKVAIEPMPDEGVSQSNEYEIVQPEITEESPKCVQSHVIWPENNFCDDESQGLRCNPEAAKNYCKLKGFDDLTENGLLCDGGSYNEGSWGELKQASYREDCSRGGPSPWVSSLTCCYVEGTNPLNDLTRNSNFFNRVTTLSEGFSFVQAHSFRSS